MWWQKELTLKARPRGFHLITREIVDQLPELHLVRLGLTNIFIKHTSASLTINENADPTVRADFESFFNRAVPENQPYYQHTLEGSDDMPAHLKGREPLNNSDTPLRDLKRADARRASQ